MRSPSSRRRGPDRGCVASERRLRVLLANVPAVVWTTDRELRITSIYGGAAGRDWLAEFEGVSLADIPGIPANAVAAHRRVLESSEAVSFQVEFRGRCFSCRAEPLFDRPGESRGVVGLGIDDTRRASAESDLQSRAREVEALSRRLADLREGERRKIAGELHDFVGANLSAATASLKLLEAHCTSHEAVDLLRRARSHLADTGRLVRGLIAELRPAVLEDFGLVPALRQLGLSDQRIEVRAPPEEVRFPPEAEMALFQAAHEAVENAKKHSGAARIHVTLRISHSALSLFVHDNGVGFEKRTARDPERRKWGHIMMRERIRAIGGRVRICSRVSAGTIVAIRWRPP